MAVQPATPAARRVAREKNINLADVRGSGEYRSVRVSDLEAPLRAAPGITGTARGMANYYGIPVEELSPAAGGRITKADVISHGSFQNGRPRGTSPAAAVSGGLAASAPEDQVFPLSGMRKVIAEKMLQGMHTQPQYTMCAELDTTAVFAFLKEAKAAYGAYGGGKLTFTDVMVKITALALMEHPRINSSLAGGEIRRHGGVDMGVAVALEEGLIVPVIRSAHALSVHRIHQIGQDLFTRARQGRLLPSEYGGSTFSISNLGNYPVDFSTPIINSPEGGILGISKTERKPVVRDEEIVIRTITGFSLTLDHRIIDGIEGAKFLKTLDEMLQRPAVVLIER